MVHEKSGQQLAEQENELHYCKVLAAEMVTHNVRRFVVEKPDEYHFKAGQATTVSLDEDGWRDKTRPFTFTSLDQDADLEFTIKLYHAHENVTHVMTELKPNDRLILRQPWGAINNRGPGTFIAGGAGVTPFIAILRQIEADAGPDGDDLRRCRLLFSNKTADDIILKGEFKRMLGDGAVFTLTQENSDRYLHGRIDAAMIERYAAGLDQPFYLCGPPAMVEDLSKVLEQIGVQPDQLVLEE